MLSERGTRILEIAMRLTLAALTLIATPLAAQDLRAPADFATIVDERARSAAMFEEAARVFQHPRCSNCHPVGERPFQGNDPYPHRPLVVRGENGMGAEGAQKCWACHTSENYEQSGVPGDPAWHLAPAEMAWHGKSVLEICEQLSDPERTGGRDLMAVIEHVEQDSLVGWGWEPGADREPAPGSAESLGALMRAWVDTGAVCPS